MTYTLIGPRPSMEYPSKIELGENTVRLVSRDLAIINKSAGSEVLKEVTNGTGSSLATLSIAKTVNEHRNKAIEASKVADAASKMISTGELLSSASKVGGVCAVGLCVLEMVSQYNQSSDDGVFDAASVVRAAAVGFGLGVLGYTAVKLLTAKS